MKKEQIISFAAGIISNGVESNLPEEKIREGLTTFTDYLNSQGYVDEESLGISGKLSSTLPELVILSSVYGSNGIANLMLNKKEQAPVQSQPQVIREVVRTETVSASSCSGGRSCCYND